MIKPSDIYQKFSLDNLQYTNTGRPSRLFSVFTVHKESKIPHDDVI